MLLKVLLLAVLLAGVICDKESESHGSRSKHYEEGEHNEDYDHEAILGSEDEAEEFAGLSPEEAKERLGKLVDKMDQNQDGTVDLDELTAWIKHSFENLNMEETKERMEGDDADKDDKVSHAEYIFAIHHMTEAELEEYKNSDLDDPEAKKLLQKNLAYDKKKFDTADADKDGNLDLAEYAAFLHPYDYDRMTGIETERVADEYDTDSNGKITLKEYLNHPSLVEQSQEDKMGGEENFKYHDANSDGFLDKDEVLKWVSPNVDQVSSEEAKHLLESTDTDKDGSLTKAEILEEHELWVGSEATDYGDMLHKDEL